MTPVALAETVRATIQLINSRLAAPSFTLSNSSGELISPPQYRGTVLVLNFWATECDGCRLEIPTFIKLEREYHSKKVTVLGIAMDVWFEQLKDDKEGWTRVNPFVATHHISYAMLMGDYAAKLAFHITELPVTVLIDKGSRIAATYIGILINVIWSRT